MLLGCDGAGKTTFSGALCGQPLTTKPPQTRGFTTCNVKVAGSPLKLWELGGGPSIRDVWTQYYASVHGAIFLVDASDGARFAEARELLHCACANEMMRGKPMLVLANKQDSATAVSAAELADALRVHEIEGSGSGTESGSSDESTDGSTHDSVEAPQCCVAAGRLDGGRSVAKGSEFDRGLSWLVQAVQGSYATLNARVERDVAAEEALAQKKREERKARVAAKKKAREEAEAAAAAEAEVAAAGCEALQPAPSTNGVDVALPAPAPGTAPSQAPASAPPSS